MTRIKKNIDTNVLIVGGGLSGLTLAAVLGSTGIDCICIDREDPARQTKESYDGRTTAISFASHRVLQAAGCWEEMLPFSEPILDIRVADGNSPLYLHFASDETQGKNPFGWIIENSLMRDILFQRVKKLKKHVTHLAPAPVKTFFYEGEKAGVVLEDGTRITAPLLVGADGRQSATRTFLKIDIKTRDYGQTAIVCNVAHEKSHENVAVEHFMPSGPFAILPLTPGEKGAHRSSVVWTEHGGDVKKFLDLLNLPPEYFDAELQKRFGDHLGRVKHISKPMAYPLRLMHAKRYTGKRVALMAEAAHVIHPIAGQGLNLSMRDIAVLAELIDDHLKLGLDIGSSSLLETYESRRFGDTLLMAGMTDILNRLFSNNLKTVSLVRGLGLGIVQKIPVLKGYFSHQAMGISGKTPRIVQKGHL